jgi:hypothetical protein
MRMRFRSRGFAATVFQPSNAVQRLLQPTYPAMSMSIRFARREFLTPGRVSPMKFLTLDAVKLTERVN